ncbi:MAG TPA: histone deacetylase [Candidatus Binatia bacterium]|nr:histone deacetylase [Candidatus Binatia bacterium]
MSRLALVRDERFRDHLTPEMHPESPKRLVAIDQALKSTGLIQEVKQLAPRPASEDELSVVHEAGYIEELLEVGKKARRSRHLVMLDADTWMSPESYDTAKLAAGAGLVAVDALDEDKIGSSFVVARPPGHHALADRPMGFCLFNNIAVAARYAQKTLGCQRVFIIDWDVHHGNGTQATFYNDPSVFFLSLHQYPFWPPNSGWYMEHGAGEGKGYNINVPLPAGTGDRGYLRAWEQLVRPVCLEYKPDLILVSAGYDAHEFDPLAQQRISTSGYAALSKKLRELAAQCSSKIIAFLEGGYNTRALSEAALVTMKVLNADTLDEARVVNPDVGTTDGAIDRSLTDDDAPDAVDERIAEVREHFSIHWKALK